MKGVSIRNSGKFPQSIQYLLLEHWKGKCMKKDSTFATDGLSNLLQTWHDVEQQICVFWAGKICRKCENFWNSLKQFSLFHQVFIYRGIPPGIDYSGKQTNKQTKEVICTMWREGSLMTSHTSLMILQSFKVIISMWKTEPSHFVCCRFQCAKTMVCSNISHQDTKNLSLCL